MTPGTQVPELTHRRWIGRLVRVGLVFVALMLVGSWLWRRASPARMIHFESEAPVAEALAPGDVQIFSRDSSVNLILRGEQVLAGLSPKTVERIRGELAQSSKTDDTSALGGAIAQFVKQTVADKIGTHFAYSLREMRDIRYEDGEIVVVRQDESKTRMFGGTKVNNESLSKTFPPDEAQRFVELARARKQSLR